MSNRATTFKGEKVYDIRRGDVAKLVNFIDGYINHLDGKNRQDVDAAFILKRVRDQIIKPKK